MERAMSSTETLKGWARRIRSPVEVPDPFRQAFWAEANGSAFPMVLYGPAAKFGRYEETPKLLVVDRDRVVCLDERQSGVERTEFRLTDVHTAEWGTALLHSWLRLDATGNRGSSSIQVDFNSVCHDLYRPVLQEYRGVLYANERTNADAERSKFDCLNRPAYKFMNLGKYSVEPGMEVRRFSMQQAVYRKILGVLRRLRAAGSLLIATQRELIVIREGDGKDAGTYEGVWTYCRLDRIEAIDDTVARPEGLRTLRVQMPGERITTLRYSCENEPVVRELLDEVRKTSSRWVLPRP
jgi:hypothetical protein